MGKMVNLKIDGKDVRVDEGLNLIEAAAAAGVHVPNLCYMKGMKGVGACRLCLVEVEGGKAPVIACNTKVKDGMVVATKTDRVQEVRKFVLDLILSMHPLDCMTCTKAGVCTLQQYAYDFDIKESSFTRKKFGYPTDQANPFIKRDPEYCVLCSRCVRVCKAQGTNVLEFSGRGVGAKVVTAQDRPLQESGCTFCGSCVDACPVNALLEADRSRKGREWEYEKVDSVCLSCGSACGITVSSKDGEVVKISSAASEGAAEKYICAIGRFGFDSLNSEARLRTPMKRVNGELRDTSWEDALATVAEKLKAADGEAGFVSTANILNEDALALKKLAADVVKTKNYDSSVTLYADYDSLKSGSADLDKADLFVLAGTAPDQWARVLPALDAVIRKRVSEGGAKLLVINSGDPKIASAASAVLKGEEIAMIEQLAQAVISKGVKAPKEMVSALAHVDPSDAAMAAADLFVAAKSPVVLAAPSLYKAAANLSLIKEEAVSVPFEANARGVVLMGLVSEGKKFKEMLSSRSKALYVIGEVPVDKRPDTDFLVVQNSHMTDLATQADVVLPSTAALESDGTIVDYLGRVKEVRCTIGAASGTKSHADIFAEVAGAMGSAVKKGKEADVKKALKAKTKAAFSPFKREKDLDVDGERFIEAINKSTINGSRLLWLKESEKGVLA